MLYETNLSVDRLTRQQLDAIALNGGKVGGIGFGYATRGALPHERYGYGFCWINTQGMGNHGVLVLVPRTQRAAEYIRQGKIRAWMHGYNLTYQEADALYSAAQGVQYGFESGVIEYALKTKEFTHAWDHFPGAGGGVWRWHEKWRMPQTDLSVWRLDAVHHIVTNLPT